MLPIHVRLSLPGFNSEQLFLLENAPSTSLLDLACEVLDKIGGFTRDELQALRESDAAPFAVFGELCEGSLVPLGDDARLKHFLLTAGGETPAIVEVRPADMSPAASPRAPHSPESSNSHTLCDSPCSQSFELSGISRMLSPRKKDSDDGVQLVSQQPPARYPPAPSDAKTTLQDAADGDVTSSQHFGHYRRFRRPGLWDGAGEANTRAARLASPSLANTYQRAPAARRPWGAGPGPVEQRRQMRAAAARPQRSASASAGTPTTRALQHASRTRNSCDGVAAWHIRLHEDAATRRKNEAKVRHQQLLESPWPAQHRSASASGRVETSCPSPASPFHVVPFPEHLPELPDMKPLGSSSLQHEVSPLERDKPVDPARADFGGWVQQRHFGSWIKESQPSELEPSPPKACAEVPSTDARLMLLEQQHQRALADLEQVRQELVKAQQDGLHQAERASRLEQVVSKLHVPFVQNTNGDPKHALVTKSQQFALRPLQFVHASLDSNAEMESLPEG